MASQGIAPIFSKQHTLLLYRLPYCGFFLNLQHINQHYRFEIDIVLVLSYFSLFCPSYVANVDGIGGWGTAGIHQACISSWTRSSPSRSPLSKHVSSSLQQEAASWPDSRTTWVSCNKTVKRLWRKAASGRGIPYNVPCEYYFIRWRNDVSCVELLWVLPPIYDVRRCRESDQGVRW